MIGALDIGGTKIAVGMVSEEGRILAHRQFPSGNKLSPQTGIPQIITMLKDMVDESAGHLEGIGISCTGPVDPMTGTMGKIEFLPDWEGIHLVAELQNAIGVKVAMENDADAAALGEYSWGAGKNAARLVYVTISTGIGVGMVFDGHLYRGADGAHPEFGHHVIDPSGPLCSCGAHGCWEILASGPAMAKVANCSTALETCQEADRGNPEALAAIEREGYYLGLGFANLVNIFVPDVIILGGGVMQRKELFLKSIQNRIRQNCSMVPYKKTSLESAQFGVQAGLIGAAQVWIHRFQ
jgi:glucokinase